MMTARNVHSGLTARLAMAIVRDETASVHAQPAIDPRATEIAHAAMVTVPSAVSVHQGAMVTAPSVVFRATDHVVTLIALTATPLRENTANLAPIRPRW
jgi:hypothetical protein